MISNVFRSNSRRSPTEEVGAGGTPARHCWYSSSASVTRLCSMLSGDASTTTASAPSAMPASASPLSRNLRQRK